MELHVPTRADFASYWRAVLRHWLILMGFVLFSLLAAAKDIAEAFLGQFVMPSWAFYTAAVLCVFAAQFMAWLDMRTQRDREKEEKDKLRTYDVTQQTLSELAELRDRLISHQNEPITSGTKLGQWIEQFKAIREEVKGVLEAKVSFAESRTYDHIGLFPRYDIRPTGHLTDAEHESYAHWRSIVSRDHKWIERFIHDYSRFRMRDSEFDYFVPLIAPSDTSQGVQ